MKKKYLFMIVWGILSNSTYSQQSYFINTGFGISYGKIGYSTIRTLSGGLLSYHLMAGTSFKLFKKDRIDLEGGYYRRGYSYYIKNYIDTPDMKAYAAIHYFQIDVLAGKELIFAKKKSKKIFTELFAGLYLGYELTSHYKWGNIIDQRPFDSINPFDMGAVIGIRHYKILSKKHIFGWEFRVSPGITNIFRFYGEKGFLNDISLSVLYGFRKEPSKK